MQFIVDSNRSTQSWADMPRHGHIYALILRASSQWHLAGGGTASERYNQEHAAETTLYTYCRGQGDCVGRMREAGRSLRLVSRLGVIPND
jgi:hypothetical protein